MCCLNCARDVTARHRQAAERKFEEDCGRDVEFYTICNHPIAVHQYKYPAEAQAQHKAYGSQVSTHTSRMWIAHTDWTRAVCV
jgi:hypothetical protein